MPSSVAVKGENAECGAEAGLGGVVTRDVVPATGMRVRAEAGDVAGNTESHHGAHGAPRGGGEAGRVVDVGGARGAGGHFGGVCDGVVRSVPYKDAGSASHADPAS